MGQKYSNGSIDEFYNKWVTLGWWATGTPIEGFVDPERLIIETTHIGRYEGRLFKAMLTWIRDYHDLINVQRLLHILEKADKPILGAAVDIAMKHGEAGDRLLPIMNHCEPYKVPEVLFKGTDDFGVYERGQKEFGKPDYLKWGLYCTMMEFYDDAIRTREYVLKNNPLLALRAKYGPTLKTDILFFLSGNNLISIKDLVEKCGENPSEVEEEILELEKKGMVTRNETGIIATELLPRSLNQGMKERPIKNLPDLLKSTIR